MYRILLVDDEVYIVDGLFNYLQHHLSDTVEVIKTYGSEEALRQARRMRIDLVISDINMPWMDGFDLLQQFTCNWPDCCFLFLTGHANFDYAYRALQHGGARFLLKSEGYERLEQTIRETIDQLTLQRQVPASAGVGRCDAVFGPFIRSWLSEDAPGLPPGGYQPDEASLCVVSRLDADADCGDEAREAALARIEVYAQQLFQSMARIFSWHVDDGAVAFLVQPETTDTMDAKAARRLVRFAKGMIEALQTLCLEGLQRSVSFAMTDGLVPAQELGHGIRVLTAVLGLPAPPRALRADSQLLCLPCQFDRLMDPQHRALLWAAVQALFAEDAVWLQAAPTLFAGQEDVALREALADVIGAWGAIADIEWLTREALAHLSLSAMLAQARRAAVSMAHRARDPHERLLYAVHAYIEEHLDDQLTLTEIAEYIHMNPSYLSRYYKKNCGENLFDYIAGRRICRAKQLLGGDKAKISDIALAVGFNSVGYFSSVFRRAVGVTPQAYRRMMRAGAKEETP